MWLPELLPGGVVPIENSLEGSVNITLDMLVQSSGVYINQELLYPVSHCLLTPPEGSNYMISGRCILIFRPFRNAGYF